MSDLTKSPPTSAQFLVLVPITFLLKIDILGSMSLIKIYDDEGKVNFLQVPVFFLHVTL